jgi:cell wall-active antibiotic response 4TMS protein YvqF
MSNKIRCHCRRCTIRGLMGPAVVITVGVLFLLEQTHTGFRFAQTWPIILVVIGVISLASAMAPMDGHIETSDVVTNPPVAPVGSVPPPPSTIVTPSTSSDPYRQGQ